jgi:hypothetical protein
MHDVVDSAVKVLGDPPCGTRSKNAPQPVAKPRRRRDLPPALKGAWQAIFDHYVFAADPAALSHLPESAQGILGELTPATASMMRRFIIGSMAKA